MLEIWLLIYFFTTIINYVLILNNPLLLSIINKFEQMEIRYFLKFTSAPINEPKIQKRGFYEFCQSSDILFDYDFIEIEQFYSYKFINFTANVSDCC